MWHIVIMHHTLIVALLARRNFLRARWEGKLRALPPSSALAEPDALVHLMGWTLEQFYQELQPTGRPPPPPIQNPRTVPAASTRSLLIS